ncbi:hypothetical protein IC235_14190 [Hymenobacter sp. BT664]|uniref:Uncharacterized protein n=1 Tax=Hymenobacter montanus TaxID=2771359 RepID=A0A927BF63_9BACT|nr:hypothetical protein [Hymenobacter montanus]MBD2769039.1 hypothetical protein [Hymenobacter montanus]
MLPEDIDDLFRNQLDGHTTPPGDALWARLQANLPAEAPDANAEQLDQLFRKGLQHHVTPPPRQLWERLEDEHLRPGKRRAPAWWPIAMAAAVALLLVAGGASLWLGFPGAGVQTGPVASQRIRTDKPAPRPQPNSSPNNSSAGPARNNGPVGPARAAEPGPLAAMGPAQPAAPFPPQKNQALRTTRPLARASGASKARLAALGQAATAGGLTGPRTPGSPAGQPAPTALAPDEPQLAPAPAPVVAAASKPAPEIVPAIAAPSLASAGEVITVDVRRGGEPGTESAPASGTALAVEAPKERRRLGGRLLQQAGHLIRGERISLAEATGLPENVTLRATVAGRTFTKSLQL